MSITDELKTEAGMREWMLEHGANLQQVNSKTMEMIVDAMADESVTSYATVREDVRRLKEVANSARGKAEAAEHVAVSLRGEMSEFRKEVEAAGIELSQQHISDRTIIDGLLAYRQILDDTMDVFGVDSMTEEVICKAIEAASYGMWRSVMGPKDNGRRADA